MAATLGQISSQVTALHREVKSLRTAIEVLMLKLDGEHNPAEVIQNEDGMFLPGTGRLGGSEKRPPAEPVVPFNEAAERAREARQALRDTKETQ